MDTNVSSSNIDPETLAAFLDGKLSPAERQKVVQALADPELYETLMEAAAVCSELRPTNEPAAKLRRGWAPSVLRLRVRPLLTPARLRIGLPIAAALAGLLVVSRVAQVGGTPDALRLVRESAWFGTAQSTGSYSLLGADWNRVTWPAQRGANSTVANGGAAFRAGVLLVNLEAAAAIDDDNAAASAGADLRGVVTNVPGGGPAAVQAGTARSESARKDLARALEQLFADSPWYGLGLWFGQARLAAAAGDLSFFAADAPGTRLLRDLRDRIAADPATRNDANTEATLNRINALLGQIDKNQLSSAAALTDSLQSIMNMAAISH